MNPIQNNRIKLWPLVMAAMAIVAMSLAFSGCGTPKLEQGGAYAPGVTNADGTFLPIQQADLPLFVADSSYKLAYDAIDAVMKFERDNRAQLQAVSPKIKTALDVIRPKVVDIERRWAEARKTYKAYPIPANLNAIQRILAEIQTLVPVVQSQLSVK